MNNYSRERREAERLREEFHKSEAREARFQKLRDRLEKEARWENPDKRDTGT